MRSRFCYPTVVQLKTSRIPADVLEGLNVPTPTPDGFTETGLRVWVDPAHRRRWEDRDRDLLIDDWIVVAYVRVDGDPRVVRFVSTSTVRPDDDVESIATQFATDVLAAVLEDADRMYEEGNDD